MRRSLKNHLYPKTIKPFHQSRPLTALNRFRYLKADVHEAVYVNNHAQSFVLNAGRHYSKQTQNSAPNAAQDIFKRLQPRKPSLKPKLLLLRTMIGRNLSIGRKKKLQERKTHNLLQTPTNSERNWKRLSNQSSRERATRPNRESECPVRAATLTRSKSSRRSLAGVRPVDTGGLMRRHLEPPGSDTS